MAKQIGVSISDEMYARYQELKEEFGLNINGRKTMSEVCREAIIVALQTVTKPKNFDPTSDEAIPF